MEAFDPSLFAHRVYFLALAQSGDEAGGVVESYPAPLGLPLPCRVRLLPARIALAGNSDMAITPAHVALPADPGARRGDILRTVPGGRSIRALAPARARDADGNLWVVDGEVVD